MWIKLKTRILKVDASNPEISKLEYAAKVIRNGGLVVFPTETVYGLGADALEPKAANSIFIAKGRPSDNPLIVHIAEQRTSPARYGENSMLYTVVKSCNQKAINLMNSFWPGPLTIVFKKSDLISDTVTAGLDTVAVRMPSHPVASMLIELSGVPVAAPSANISGRPSSTRIEHVIEDLYGRVDVIIDSGNSTIGLESTVIDVSSEPCTVLRPGGITIEQIKKIIPEVEYRSDIYEFEKSDDVPKAPGMKYTHYSPDAEVFVIEGEVHKIVQKIKQLCNDDRFKNKKIGILATKQTANMYEQGTVITAGDRHNPETIAMNLFDILRSFDSENIEVVFAEGIEETGIGTAVMNRMRKAAGRNNIIKV